jgi:hypothetical protein
VDVEAFMYQDYPGYTCTSPFFVVSNDKATWSYLNSDIGYISDVTTSTTQIAHVQTPTTARYARLICLFIQPPTASTNGRWRTANVGFLANSFGPSPPPPPPPTPPPALPAGYVYQWPYPQTTTSSASSASYTISGKGVQSGVYNVYSSSTSGGAEGGGCGGAGEGGGSGG